MTDFRAIAKTLETTAALLEANPRLDPDAAVRQAIWGTPAAHVPVNDTADSRVYDDVTSAIEGYDAQLHGYECGDGIDRMPRGNGIRAARAEAARFRSYTT